MFECLNVQHPAVKFPNNIFDRGHTVSVYSCCRSKFSLGFDLPPSRAVQTQRKREKFVNWKKKRKKQTVFISHKNEDKYKVSFHTHKNTHTTIHFGIFDFFFQYLSVDCFIVSFHSNFYWLNEKSANREQISFPRVHFLFFFFSSFSLPMARA